MHSAQRLRDFPVYFHSCVYTIVVSWNVHGINNPSKCRRIKEALLDIRPDWIGIQESKMSKGDSSIIAQISRLQEMGFAILSFY